MYTKLCNIVIYSRNGIFKRSLASAHFTDQTDFISCACAKGINTASDVYVCTYINIIYARVAFDYIRLHLQRVRVVTGWRNDVIVFDRSVRVDEDDQTRVYCVS